MSALAKARFVRLSPQKVRRVVALIRGKTVDTALRILEFLPNRPAKIVLEVIRSAQANFSQKERGKHKPEELWIRKVYVDEGPRLVRWRAAARGRAVRIRRRYSHITVEIGD
jgi:large subunit ribosomal protein L22